MEKNSVIVPVCKVKSVVNQTCQNLEILLIDDGSPERCPEMCGAWEKRAPSDPGDPQEKRGALGGPERGSGRGKRGSASPFS